jgi:hypothetical protein
MSPAEIVPIESGMLIYVDIIFHIDQQESISGKKKFRRFQKSIEILFFFRKSHFWIEDVYRFLEKNPILPWENPWIPLGAPSPFPADGDGVRF